MSSMIFLSILIPLIFISIIMIIVGIKDNNDDLKGSGLFAFLLSLGFGSVTSLLLSFSNITEKCNPKSFLAETSLILELDKKIYQIDEIAAYNIVKNNNAEFYLRIYKNFFGMELERKIIVTERKSYAEQK